MLSEQRVDEDHTDVLVGMRYHFRFNERWGLLTRGDASFGPSEGTVLLRANLTWSVGKRRQNHLLFGYQYKQAEYRPDLLDLGLLGIDFTYHGPIAGFNFQF